MLVATAGHIDHGKTSVIRALTGVDTDRLPEERARGISIDIGFAYWKPQDGRTIGFVDVPGHERFVRNLLVGVSAVDFALLVVAADDGVMPQSVEHLQILDLLDIARGLVAISKCDRVTRERVDAVRAEVRALLAPTSLSNAAIFEISSVTGEGVAALREALRAANRNERAHASAGHHFRMSIDRSFSVTGVGTVVTGTALAGVVETEAKLTVSPRGLPVRVRGLQSAGQPVTRVESGERCAVNLAGIEVAQIHRGDWLVSPPMHAPSSRIEVRVRLVPGAALKHSTLVHLYLGTANTPARVLIPGGAPVAPGAETIVQLVLQEPVSAVNGDRFVLRDQAGHQLIGGGRVVDPFASADRRRQSSRAAVSAALQLGDAAQSLAALLAISGYEVETLQFERCFNLDTATAHEHYRRANAVLLGSSRTLALPAARVASANTEIVEVLKRFHAEQPEASGMSARDLKSKLSTAISSEALLLLQRLLTEKGSIVSVGSVLRLPGHTISFSSVEAARWQMVLPQLQRRGAQPFTARELANELHASEPIVKALLHRRRSNGDVWPITDHRFMLRQQIAALAARAAVLAQEVGGEGFTAAQYRDAIGIGRNLAIQILEFFDTVGVTRRTGDLRKMRPDYELVVGTAVPYAPRP